MNDALDFNQVVIFVSSKARAQALGTILANLKAPRPAFVTHGELQSPIHLPVSQMLAQRVLLGLTLP